MRQNRLDYCSGCALLVVDLHSEKLRISMQHRKWLTLKHISCDSPDPLAQTRGNEGAAARAQQAVDANDTAALVQEAVASLLAFSYAARDAFDGPALRRLLTLWLPGRMHRQPVGGFMRKKACRELAAAVASACCTSGELPDGVADAGACAPKTPPTPRAHANTKTDERSRSMFERVMKVSHCVKLL